MKTKNYVLSLVLFLNLLIAKNVYTPVLADNVLPNNNISEQA